MKKLTTLITALMLCMVSFTGHADIRTAMHSDAAKGLGIALPKGQMPRVIRAGNQLPAANLTTASKALAPAKASPSGANIYGWLVYVEPTPEDASGFGFCDIYTDATYNTRGWGGLIGFDFPGFFVRDGKACVIGEFTYAGLLVGYYYIEYDMATGKQLSEQRLPMADYTTILRSCAYDPYNNAVYGYTYVAKSGDKNKVGFVKIDMNNPTEIIHIADVPSLQICTSITFNQDEDELVGINNDGGFVKIDRLTGEQTELAYIPVFRQDVKSGLCWSPKDNAYIWNAYTKNDGSLLYAIDPVTFELTLLGTYEGFEDFAGFYCTDRAQVADNAPADPVIKSFDFPNGALSGSVTYTMPSLTGAGNPIMGNISYTVELDGAVYKTGTAAAGQDVEVTFSNLALGSHTFKIYTSLNGQRGRSVSTTKYIGPDTPVKVVNVKIDENGISWDPVTSGIHDGYIDLDKLVYTVYVNEATVARNIKGTHCDYTFPADKELTVYEAQVEASYDGELSEISESAFFPYGKPFSVPMSVWPTGKDQYLFTIEDTNADGTTWLYGTYTDGTGYFHKNTFYYNEDWLFLPAVNITDTKCLYNLTLDAATRSDGYVERFEVWIGNEPKSEAMTQNIFERTEVVNKEFAPYSTDFQIKQPGVYYIGVKSCSRSSSYYFFVRNFNLKVSDKNVNTPARPTALTATAAPLGELKANVTFTMPSKNLVDSALPADEDLQATVRCVCEEDNSDHSVTVSGKPGQTVTASVPSGPTFNTVTVTVSNSDGTSESVSTDVFCGIDLPKEPTEFTIEAGETNHEAILKWKAPVEGINGGYIAPTDIDYYLALYDEAEKKFKADRMFGTDVFTGKYTITEGTPMKSYRIGVLAENEMGRSTYVAAGSIVLGTPLSLPLRETYAGGSVECQPFTVYSLDNDESVNWTVMIPSVAGEKYELPEGQYALVGRATKAGVKGRYALPKFSTEGITDPALSFNIYKGGCTDVEILATCAGTSEPVSLGKLSDMNLADGYNRVEIKLPQQFIGKKWVGILLDAQFDQEGQACVIESYTVKNSLAKDLAVINVTGTQSCTIATPATFTATMRNEGFEAFAFPGGTWTVENAQGVIIATEQAPAATELIQPDATANVTFTFNPNAEMAGDCVIKFTINDADLDPANNSESIAVKVERGNAVVVTDLRAVNAGNDFVDLEWTEPELAPGYESFEDETPWVESPSRLGAFLNVDLDQAKVYGHGKFDYAGKGQPGAFAVWSQRNFPGSADDASRFYAADGRQFLIAFCPDINKKNVAADDWLISPQVTPGTEVSFSAKPITYQYGAEIIEVLYSTTDRDPASFKPIKTFEYTGASAALTTWEKRTFTLPDDAKYFAIRYVSKDIMGIMIDDIAWTPWYGTTRIEGYDIYRDGVCIESNAAAPGYYTDETVADPAATYSYNVVPVLHNGLQGLMSNTATVQPSGIGAGIIALTDVRVEKGTIIVTGSEPRNVVIIAADGKTIAADKQVTSRNYRVQPGVYMVVVAGKTCKVLVP